jgi:hypothetical protein
MGGLLFTPTLTFLEEVTRHFGHPLCTQCRERREKRSQDYFLKEMLKYKHLNER